MTVEEAIKHVDDVCAKFHGTRADHQLLMVAVQTIRQAVQESKKAEDKKKK